MDSGDKTTWEYKPDGSKAAADPLAAAADSRSKKSASARSFEPISWTASEYIEHSRTAGWYMLLAVATGSLAAAAYFATKDYFSAGIIALVGIAVGIFAARKPKQVTYEISRSGVRIGEKSYPYSHFRSFCVINEGNVSNLYMVPVKRFMVPISAYFEPAEAERIVNAIGEHLPYEEQNLDRIDKLSRRLRF